MSTRYLYSARLLPIGKPVWIPLEDGGPPELMTFTDESFELERTAKTKPPVWLTHDKNLDIGRVVQLYRSEGWWCAEFALDPDVPDDIEFEVGQPISVGLTGLKIGSRPTFLRDVSIVRRAAVQGAEITRRWPFTPASMPALKPPAARSTTSDHATPPVEYVYDEPLVLIRPGIGRVLGVR